jgi:hypothetical protein
VVGDVRKVYFCQERNLSTQRLVLWSNVIDGLFCDERIGGGWTLRGVMISQAIDQVVDWLQSALKDVEFSRNDVEFASMFHFWVGKNIDFLIVSLVSKAIDQVGDEFLIGRCNGK